MTTRLNKKLRKDNEGLKSLLQQCYDESFIDDTIADLKGDNDSSNDAYLGHLLFLRNSIHEVLGLKLAKELKPLMTEDSLKVTRHNGSKVLEKHYEVKSKLQDEIIQDLSNDVIDLSKKSEEVKS